MPSRDALRRVGPMLALALLGFAIVLSANVAHPGPRLSRKARLVDLIRREDDRARHLRSRLDALTADLERIEGSVALQERGLRGLRQRLEALGPLAGLTAVEGPGVSVELRDSILRDSPSGDPNDLVVHEQDLQAIVNALWSAGAEAIAVNGERITATSAVRCVGNTLLLHGSVYSPPYRVQAVGDPAVLIQGLERDPLVARFRVVAEDLRLGFDVKSVARLEVPPFRGVLAARFARRATPA